MDGLFDIHPPKRKIQALSTQIILANNFAHICADIAIIITRTMQRFQNLFSFTVIFFFFELHCLCLITLDSERKLK